MTAEDWATVASLATALSTVVLAVATFSSVRSANRSARTAERAFMAGLRPLLVTSRPEDPMLKVGFMDDHWVQVPGGQGSAESTGQTVYLVMSVRNVGSGIAVLHGWSAASGRVRVDEPMVPPEEFRHLTRDLYVPPNDVGFWQGAMRDPETAEFAELSQAVAAGGPITVDLLYGDYEGGQRTVSRFAMMRAESGAWVCVISRHWNLDRANPR